MIALYFNIYTFLSTKSVFDIFSNNNVLCKTLHLTELKVNMHSTKSDKTVHNCNKQD